MTETAIFAAGCFWGVEAEFRRADGVLGTRVGYTGGRTEHPTYRQVCGRRTGHAEAVEVTFDPDQVTYEELLERFWATHDPTTKNRQGPDLGSQYRSAIFFTSPEQLEQATRSKRARSRPSSRRTAAAASSTTASASSPRSPRPPRSGRPRTTTSSTSRSAAGPVATWRSAAENRAMRLGRGTNDLQAGDVFGAYQVHRAPRRGRHGHRLQGHPRRRRRPRRAEARQGRVRHRRALPPALPARGARRVGGQPPAPRQRRRRRRGRRPPVPRHAARQPAARSTRSSRPESCSRPPTAAKLALRDRRRARRPPRPRRHAPRRQGRQHPAPGRRLRRPDRLRARQGHRLRGPDRRRPDRRHDRVPRARAHHRPGGRARQRPLRARLRHLREPRRQDAVRRQGPDGDRVRPPGGGAARPVRRARGPHARRSARAVLTALAKDPAERPATARDYGAGLQGRAVWPDRRLQGLVASG